MYEGRITRSKARKLAKSMVTLEEIEKLLDPLREALKDVATNQSIENSMKQLEERLSSKIVSQAKEIAELKADNEKLKAALGVQERRFNLKIEETEQYGKRLCLRVDGLPIKDQESADSVLADIKQELNKSGINVPDHAIDRAH